MKYLNLILLSLISLIFIIGLATALPPQAQTTSANNLQIAYPNYAYVALNSPFELCTHVTNLTSYVKNANCYLDLYEPDGKELEAVPIVREGLVDYCLTLDAGNFSMKGPGSYVIYCNTTAEAGVVSGTYFVTNSGYENPGDNFTVFIFLLFVFSIILLFYTFFLTLGKLVTAEETIYDVLLAWSSYILVIIVNYLGKEYLLRTFIENLTEQFLTYTAWTNVVLPLLAFIITFFVKSTKKKNVLSPQEIGGFR